jgi:hypothetical protein
VHSGGVGGGIFCSCGYIAVVHGSGGEVLMKRQVALLVFMINNIGLADYGGSGLPQRLVLGMDIGDISSGLGVGYSGLFSMADEVLEVLYRGHDDNFAVVDKRRLRSVGKRKTKGPAVERPRGKVELGEWAAAADCWGCWWEGDGRERLERAVAEGGRVEDVVEEQ